LKKSFIKLYGPPIVKALKVLENLAVDNPEVCIMHFIVANLSPGGAVQECEALISKSKEDLGEYDFFYEWYTDPTRVQLEKLISQIDEALNPLGCKYTITTK